MGSIHDATRSRDLSEITAIVGRDGCQVNAPDNDKRTPLILAAESGALDVCEALVGLGAAVNATDGRNATALYLACLRGHNKVVQLLLSHGADASITAERGWSCLMASTAHPHIMRALLESSKSLDVDARDEWGCSALWWACWRGHAESAKMLLLDRRADYTRPGLNRTPYDVARTHGHATCLRVLEWYQQEIERGYLLEKARSLLDDEQSISKAGAQAQTPHEAAQARAEAAPPYLVNRVKKGDPVPQVEVAMGSKRKGQQERRAVIEHVLVGLRREVYDDLMGLFRIR